MHRDSITIIAGSNVEGDCLCVVEIPREHVQKAVTGFMSCSDALLIGCAGLKSMLRAEIKGKTQKDFLVRSYPRRTAFQDS